MEINKVYGKIPCTFLFLYYICITCLPNFSMKKITYLLIILLGILPHHLRAADQPVDSLLTAFQQTKGKNRIQIANQLATHYQELSDTLFVFNDKTPDDELEFLIMYWGGEYANEEGNYQLSKDLVEQAIPLCRNEEDLGNCYSLASAVYTRLGDFPTALKYDELCLELDRKSGIPENLSSSLNNIAALYVTANQPEKAVQYIQEAIQVERPLNRPSVLAIRLGMASEILINLGRGTEALAMAEEAVQLEQAHGKAAKVPVRLSQLAAVYMKLDRLQEAYDTYLKAKDGLEKEGNLNSLSITLCQLGVVCSRQNKWDEACDYYLQSAELCQKTGNLYIESKARHYAWELLRERDPKAALEQLERYTLLADSLYTTQTAENLTEFNVKYETAEKEHQIELQREQLANHRLGLILLAVLALAALIGCILTWRLAMLRGKTNKMLVRTNLLKDRLLSLAKTENEKQIQEVATEMSQLGAMPQIHLTKRERQVVALCCTGKLNKEIADELDISLRTVEAHKTNIFKKLGINTTVELMKYAHQSGIIT